MRNTLRIGSFVLALGLLATAGIAHGLWTGRWGVPADLEAAGERLGTIPMRLGDWEAEAGELDPRQAEIARITGHVTRVYTHAYTGDRITLMIVCGRPAPIALHPPDVCYRGAGYVPSDTESAEFGDSTFTVADLTKPGPDPAAMRIYWGWSDSGKTWSAPDSPRREYLGSGHLYKMYVLTPPRASDSDDEDGPTRDFFDRLLPELANKLAGS